MAQEQYGVLVYDEDTEQWNLLGPYDYATAAQHHRMFEEDEDEPVSVLIKILSPM